MFSVKDGETTDALVINSDQRLVVERWKGHLWSQGAKYLRALHPLGETTKSGRFLDRKQCLLLKMCLP